MKKSSEEIKLTFTQTGKKIGAISILVTMIGGLAQYFTGVAKDIDRRQPALAKENEKALIRFGAKQEENTKSIDRIYNKLNQIEKDQKTVLKILIEKLK